MRVLYAFISLLCPTFFLWLQASLIYSAETAIRAENNERKLSNIPYLTLLTNCFLWVVYGQLEHEMTVFITNLIGIIVGIYCVATYHLYSMYPPNPIHYYLVSSIIIVCLIADTLQWKSFIGILAMISAIMVYGSPLVTIGVVLAERSTRSMPFLTSLAAFFTACAWTIYGGVVARDLEILIPSIIGIILASTQLFLYVLYGFDSTVLLYTRVPQTSQAPGNENSRIGNRAAMEFNKQHRKLHIDIDTKESTPLPLSSYQQTA